MNRRDFNIGAVLALFCTGAISMSPENERKAVAALERIASALETMARNAGRSALAEAELMSTGFHAPGCGTERRGCMPDCDNYDPKYDDPAGDGGHTIPA